MEKIECTSCKQEISPVENYVKFPCPECEEDTVQMSEMQNIRTFIQM